MKMNKFFNILIISLIIGFSAVFTAKAIYQQPVLEAKEDKCIHEPADTLVKPSVEFEAFRKIVERYERPDYMVVGTMRFYGDNEPEGLQTISFTSISAGENYLYEIDSVQTVSVDGAFLLVDKKEQRMVLLNPQHGRGKISKGDVASELKKIGHYIESITVNPSGNENRMSLKFSKEFPGNVIAYDIWYDPSDFRVLKIRMEVEVMEIDGLQSNDTLNTTGNTEDGEIMFVDENNEEVGTGLYGKSFKRVFEISYLEEKPVGKDFIQAKHYFNKENDLVVPTGDYKKFEVIN